MFIFLVRTKRVREARDEAKKEIEEYRKAKEEEFRKFEAQVCQSTTVIITTSHSRPYSHSAFRHLEADATCFPQHSAGNKQAEDEANKEAEIRIKEIKAAGQKSQEKVINDLLKAVFEVKPVPPSAAQD